MTPEPEAADRAWSGRSPGSACSPPRSGRRPTGPAERIAADRMRDELSRAGVRAEVEPFPGYENVDPDVVGRALEVGREMIAAIDRGEAN
jgi:hypothetical protein